jgi:DNA repair protein RecO (recombination protein O)
MSADKVRFDDQPGYVLHTYPFRETSLVVEVFTRSQGRVAMVARGGRRPKSSLRGLLLGFQPLLLSWFGKGELRTLHKAEWGGPARVTGGQPLLCGFYLNELLLYLLPKEDPHESLYDAYQQALAALASGDDLNAALRHFELALLRELGYGLQIEHEADSGQPVEPGVRYLYVFEHGLRRAERESGGDGVQLRGKTLLDMACGDYSDPVTRQQSKALMRAAINRHLGGATLHTRQLMRELLEL